MKNAQKYRIAILAIKRETNGNIDEAKTHNYTYINTTNELKYAKLALKYYKTNVDLGLDNEFEYELAKHKVEMLTNSK